jgi:hypothetical protein
LSFKTIVDICQWFGLKITGTVSPGLASKTGGDGFSRFGLKTGGGGFLGLCLKSYNYGLVIWGSNSL